MMRYDVARKSMGVAYLLWVFVGFLGLHRFYLGWTRSAAALLGLLVVSLLLAGFVPALAVPALGGFVAVGLWWFLDAFLIPGMTRTHNERVIERIRGRAEGGPP